MGKLTLYGIDPSPPVRAVKLTLAALELPYDFVVVNLMEKEHLSEEYQKKNPQHTVPTLEDGDVCLTDSHAIMCYLVNKYGKDDSLYPKDPYQRAVVDQRLHYDSSTMFSSTLLNITKPLLFMGVTEISKSKIDAVVAAYDLVEILMANCDYIAGNKLTVADFSFITTISCMQIILDVNPTKYPRIVSWLKRLKDLPYYEEVNGAGAAQLEAMIKDTNFTIESS